MKNIVGSINLANIPLLELESKIDTGDISVKTQEEDCIYQISYKGQSILLPALHFDNVSLTNSQNIALIIYERVNDNARRKDIINYLHDCESRNHVNDIDTDNRELVE